MSNEIQSDKLFIRDVFNWWYRVPDYQRPYVWGLDQVNDLLDDVAQWQYARPDSEYFLGSIVLQQREQDGFQENDLLDGQQRLTTCLMMHAVARDLTENAQLKESCRRAVFQAANPFDSIPERLRIVYDIRDEVRDFVDKFVKTDGGTNDEAALKAALSAKDLSVRNMANALLEIRRYFTEADAPDLGEYFKFFRNKVLMIYVASPNLDDAFRLFTVLNDRGIKLRGSDILKTLNLRALRDEGANDQEQKKYAQMWEDLESELGDDFDVFLSHLRAVLVKDKARLSLLQEFEENIYAPREFDQKQKVYRKRTPLLKRGRDTFKFVQRYHEQYRQVFSGNNYDLAQSWEFDNLITLLNETGLADFWVPPLLRYRDVFGDHRITEFLRKLENKFCGDWVASETPTDRITAMNRITVAVDEVNDAPNLNNDQKIDKLLGLEVFNFDKKKFSSYLEYDDVYRRRFARYLLFKLDLLYSSAQTRLQAVRDLSVEHILPQNPKLDSDWCIDFDDDEREVWTNRLGNLILLGRRKNSSQGRLDYDDKVERYFKRNIETFPNSVRVLQKYRSWTLPELQANHKDVVQKLQEYCQ